ncbi:MAG: TIGR00296 family protein [Candidatus Aenigmatarchaeota archaeon]
MDEIEARFGLDLARAAIKKWLRTNKILELKKAPSSFEQKRGVFISLYIWPEKELRGCIGLPYPVLPLHKAIISSAIEAANDPRFEPVKIEELERIIFELSVLTEPRELFVKNTEDYPKYIRIGRDGLIVKKGAHTGLLLPQVATEYGFDENEFLIQTCLKAGLPPMAWTDSDTKIYTFQAEVWTEKRPEGDVIRLL